jgi:Transglutaminase-like superfamily
MIIAVRPLFGKNVSAIDSNEPDTICVMDPEVGGLSKIDTRTGRVDGLVNFEDFDQFRGAMAFTMGPDGTVHYCRSNRIYTVGIKDGSATRLNEPITIDAAQTIVGLCTHGACHYVADVAGRLLLVENGVLARTVQVGKGISDMTVHDGRILILCGISRCVHIYSLDGTALASATLPHEGAAGIASVKTSSGDGPGIYIYYHQHSWEVFDDVGSELGANGNANLEFRDDVFDAFIERFDYKLVDLGRGNNLCLSKGYEVEFTYAEMVKPLRHVLDRLQGLPMCARLSVPVNTPRQRVKSLEIVGDVPAVILDDEHGNPIIEYDLTSIKLDRACRMFGYQAIVHTYGIRYKVNGSDPADCPDDIRQRFLKEESRYDMGRRELQEVAAGIMADLPDDARRDAVRIAKAVREYVYRRLDYRYSHRYTNPVETLRLGIGTCGKYMELMIGLMRLCGVACRPVGDFKVPEYKLRYERVNAVCTPDHDHAWVEFYEPEVGWLPIESSSDGVPEKQDRFFGALSWIYLENSRTARMCDICKPGSWESYGDGVKYSDLFVPEIQIRILGETALD